MDTSITNENKIKKNSIIIEKRPKNADRLTVRQIDRQRQREGGRERKRGREGEKK